MTIRLLSTYQSIPPNSIISLDAGIEGSLVAAKNATLDLTGGVRFYRDVQAPQLVPAKTLAGPVSLQANQRVPLPLPEGLMFSITGASNTNGQVQRLDDDGAVVQAWPINTGAMLSIGPYAGQRRFMVTCSEGSVVVTAFNAALSSIRIGQNTGSMRGGGTGLPATTNSVSSGATIKTFQFAVSAWGPFHAVQLIFANHTTTPALIDNSCVGTTNTAYPGGVFNISNPSSGFGAPSGSTLVPVAVGATEDAQKKRPGMALSVKAPARSVQRAAGELDGGKYELLCGRIVRLANNNTFTFGDLGSNFAATWDQMNEGFSVLTANPVFGTDAVTSPGSVVASSRETGVAGVAIVGVLFHYDQKMTCIGGPGDSVFVGASSSNGVIGAPYLFKATARVRASGKMVSYFNAGISGSPMQSINGHGRDLVDLNLLDLMVLHSHTINGAVKDGSPSSSSDWDAQWDYMLDLAQYHLDKKAGNQVLILTPLPNNSFTAAQNILRLKQRERVRACGLPFVDVESLADSLGHWANPAHAGDGTHPPPAGHEAIAALVQPALAAMVP